VTVTGVSCAPFGCALMTENPSGLCGGPGGVFLANGSCDDCPTTCFSDINRDGVVIEMDLSYLLSSWGACP
jgi:hypothetical protein